MPSNQPERPEPDKPDEHKKSQHAQDAQHAKDPKPSGDSIPPADAEKTFGDVVREMTQKAQARKNKAINPSQEKLTVQDVQKLMSIDPSDHSRRQQTGDHRDRHNAPDNAPRNDETRNDNARNNNARNDDARNDSSAGADRPSPAVTSDHRVPVLPVISTRALSFAAWRAGRTLHRQFSALRISKRGLPPDTQTLPDQPVLIYCNHPSVWTATLGMYLATKLWPDWRHYAPSEPEHISRYTLTDKIGLLPVESGYAGAAHLLRTGQNILCCPGQMLWLPATFTPADPRLRPMPLSRVIPLLARKFDDLTILPLAIEHPYRSAELPEALIRFGEPFSAHDAGRRSLQSWHNLLQRRLQMVMDRLAEEAADPLPTEFEILW